MESLSHKMTQTLLSSVESTTAKFILNFHSKFLSKRLGREMLIVWWMLQETTYLYIPNNAVGAIIGTKGSHIRNMIRFSGASVKIAPMDENQKDSQQAERKVTIVGSPESQWKVAALVILAFFCLGIYVGCRNVLRSCSCRGFEF